MTNQSNKSVGIMTMVNLTANELEVWINSHRTSYMITEMKTGEITFREQDKSPVENPKDASLIGFEPSTKSFLRSLEHRPGYFHNGENVITVDRGGVHKNYSYNISGQDNQVLSNSAAITVTRSSFIVAAPNGTIWYHAQDKDIKAAKSSNAT